MKWMWRANVGFGVAALAVMTTSPSSAALRWDFAQKPPPTTATLPTGRAVAVCAASARGMVSECKLLLDEPEGGTVGQDLLSRSSLYQMHPRSKRCATKLDKVSISNSSPAADVNANWLRRPTWEDVFRSYPADALRRKLRASIVLACEVTEGGELKACRGLFVDGAEDAGFEAAAVSLAPVFKLTPASKGGKPTRSFVTVPLNFEPVRPPC